MSNLADGDAPLAAPALTTPEQWRDYLREYSETYRTTATAPGRRRTESSPWTRRPAIDQAGNFPSNIVTPAGGRRRTPSIASAPTPHSGVGRRASPVLRG
ncbi:hypothetical protein FRAAL5357 [Frankia alni ACN14a]|uniref:Uncharacterized protein n=1 Tax=Frankia alni (strain DSM 45986 / CECT 9034 / ACN14a) TaxID=326424 RepID=Q0REW4_FRAAA|nr:hypothetical protein FRAAL5357 [Frankia alni ACN14a]